jgi:hypothetical protein
MGLSQLQALLRDLIVGSSQAASYWVGGTGDPKPPDGRHLHRLELKRELCLGTEYVVCYIGTSALPIAAYQFNLNTQSSAAAKVTLVTLQSGIG